MRSGMSENVEAFIYAFAESLRQNTFVKATLGNYKGADRSLQKVNIRRIETKRGERLFFLYKQDTRDTAKNYSLDEGLNIIGDALSGDFFSGHLFTTEQDLQLDIGKKGRSRLNKGRPTFKNAVKTPHDRTKRQLIDSNSFYLNALGITTAEGAVRDKQQNKWRQINKFVEIVAAAIETSSLKGAEALHIVDMGSGKGYLTFALYEYLTNAGVKAAVTGVEARANLAEICSGIADASGFDGLKFLDGAIDSIELDAADILIVLHACNTATDDALYKGIRANAELIIAAPCCHQELRPQIVPPPMLRDVLKYGVLLERTAETLTDGIRAMLLEREGYAVKMLEFVPVEHTPKNNMLIGTHHKDTPRKQELDREIRELMAAFWIKHQRLLSLLDTAEGPAPDAAVK